MRATDKVAGPVVDASGGTTAWLQDGVPELRKVDPGRRAFGRDWLGVRANGAYRVLGTRDTPLLPPFLALILLVGTATLAWWREGRGSRADTFETPPARSPGARNTAPPSLRRPTTRREPRRLLALKAPPL